MPSFAASCSSVARFLRRAVCCNTAEIADSSPAPTTVAKKQAMPIGSLCYSKRPSSNDSGPRARLPAGRMAKSPLYAYRGMHPMLAVRTAEEYHEAIGSLYHTTAVREDLESIFLSDDWRGYEGEFRPYIDELLAKYDRYHRVADPIR